MQEQVTHMEGMLGVIAMTKGSWHTKKGDALLFSLVVYTKLINDGSIFFDSHPPQGALLPPPALVPAASETVLPATATMSQILAPSAPKLQPTQPSSFALASTEALSLTAPSAPPFPAPPVKSLSNPVRVSAISSPIDPQHHQQCWDELTAHFSEEKLRHHTWEWESGRLIPFYAFQTVSKITDIWDEHSNGLNGYLAVQDLYEYWGARWRHNRDGQRTENCRRKKVVHLVEKLTKKANWNIKLALRFLHDKYETRSMTP